jgi:hypothetical protein
MSGRRCDPSLLTPEARLAELGALLARGYRRMVQNRQNEVADSAETERPCGRAVAKGPPLLTPRTSHD